MSDLEEMVDMVRAAGLSTGHADTPRDLLAEVLEDVKELRAKIAKLQR